MAGVTRREQTVLQPITPGIGVLSKTSATGGNFYTVIDITSGAGKLTYVSKVDTYDDIRITVDGVVTTLDGIDDLELELFLDINFYTSLKVEVQANFSSAGSAQIAKASYCLI